MSEPCDLPALEARRLIGAGALSPVALMESCLARIEAVNGPLNAVVAVDPAALDAARRSEARVRAGEALGPLEGLPVAIKDSQAVRGLRTTHGSLLYEDHVPEEDEPSVATLRRAGAIPFAKTNLPEFGAGANTVNRVYGVTANPFDATRTCAGSSGGSAVALATGMAPLATGSDYGGSLRTPAAFCGVTGFRPSLGVAPHAMSSAVLSPFGVNGPMARSLADALLLLSVQAQHDPRDFFSRPGPAPIPPGPADLSTLRLAVTEDYGAAPVAKEIRATFRERLAPLSAARLADAAPEVGPIHDVFEITRGVAFLAAHHERLKTDRDRLDVNVVDNCERGLAFSAADVAWAQAQQTQYLRRTVDFFEEFDAILAPAAAVPPFPHDELYVREIDGEAMPTYMRWLAISYIPTLAFCCSVALPAGRDTHGLPFGLQVIGPPGSDARTLAAALAVEAALAADPATARPVPDLARIPT